MKDEEFQEILLAKLDRITHLLEMAEKREIENLKEKVLGRSAVKRNVYDLIDGKRTVNKISKMLRLVQPSVSRAISELMEGGLVGKKTKGKHTVYYKKFED